MFLLHSYSGVPLFVTLSERRQRWRDVFGNISLPGDDGVDSDADALFARMDTLTRQATLCGSRRFSADSISVAPSFLAYELDEIDDLLDEFEDAEGELEGVLDQDNERGDSEEVRCSLCLLFSLGNLTWI